MLNWLVKEEPKQVIVGGLLIVLAALGFFVGLPFILEAVSLNGTVSSVFWFAVILIVLFLIHKRGHSKVFYTYVSVFVAGSYFFTGVAEGFNSAITYTVLASGLIAFLLIFKMRD